MYLQFSSVKSNDYEMIIFSLCTFGISDFIANTHTHTHTEKCPFIKMCAFEFTLFFKFPWWRNRRLLVKTVVFAKVGQWRPLVAVKRQFLQTVGQDTRFYFNRSESNSFGKYQHKNSHCPLILWQLFITTMCLSLILYDLWIENVSFFKL